MGIEGKENLGAPDWSPTPVKMEDGQLQTIKGIISATDTVSDQWKESAVGQRTPVWFIQADRKLQQFVAPTPSGEDWPGRNPPRNATGEPVTGATTNVHRSENKQKRRKLREEQGPQSCWQTDEVNFELPQDRPPPGQYQNNICPSGMAVHHPAYAKLLEYFTKGCPVKTRRNWSK